MLKSPEMIHLGKIIRRRREAIGISQENFAHELGIARSYYWRVEHGLINVRLLKLIQIAKGLGTTASDILQELESLTAKKKR
jgi:transcriptional regulator with XRE-family HTH domain